MSQTKAQLLGPVLGTVEYAGDVNFDSGTLFVDSANNRVGIGTTNPQTNLTIYSDSAKLTVTGNAGGSSILMGNQNSLGANNPAWLLSANGSFYFGKGDSWNGGGNFTGLFTIANDGNIGIGTLNPVEKLHVYSASSVSSINIDSGNSGTTIYYNLAGVRKYTAEYVPANDFYSIGRSGVAYDLTLKNGNVGIGTTNPSTKLSVNGTITESTNGTNYWPVVTQQDIGTAPNQVPINGYLGSLAYEDIDSVVLPSLTVTGRSVFSGTGSVNANTSQNEYAYYFDLVPSKNTWIDATDGVNNVRSHALYVRTPVLDNTNVDGIILAESGGQASGKNSITFLNEDLNGGGGYTKARLYTQVGSSYQSTTFFIDVADAGRTIQNRLRINEVGDVIVNSGNLVIGTSGKGIDFSANANAAGMTSELLDDYEEGTFTPQIIGWTGTYSIQYGMYTKVGRMVTIQCEVQTNGGTGSFNTAFPGISNLPFARDNTTPSYRAMGVWGIIGTATYGANQIGAGLWDAHTSTTELFPNNFTVQGGIGNFNGVNSANSFGYRSLIVYKTVT